MVENLEKLEELVAKSLELEAHKELIAALTVKLLAQIKENYNE